MKKLLYYLTGKEFLILSVISLAMFYGLQKAGLFAEPPLSDMLILHGLAARILCSIIGVNALFGIIRLYKEEKAYAGAVLFYMSLIVFAVAVWVSFYTRFEGRSLKAEGQSFGAFYGQFVPQTRHTAKYSKLPQIGLTLLKISPEMTSDVKRLKNISIDVLYTGKGLQQVKETKITNKMPFFLDWTFISITDIGYAVKYQLKDQKGMNLEDDIMFLKLFPPGTAEDYFETMFLGYLFNVRIYPDYADKGGIPTTLSAYLKNPVYNIRIVRNKDIVYNGLVKQEETVRFDRTAISLPRARLWVELTFVRDLGIPFALAGILLMITGLTLMALKKQ